MIAGINKAYILPSAAVVARGYSINGERVGLTVASGATWMEIPLQRGEGEYTCTVSVSKSGRKHAHKATIEVLTISAAVEHAYRELSRARHLLALVLNGGETVIVGIDCPARLSMEPYTAEKPGDGIGFSIQLTCESRIGYERYNGKLEEDIVVPVSGFGLYYNFFAVDNILFAPDGWHVPTKDEFDTLLSVVGVDSSFLLRIADNQFWNNINGVTNEYNFSAIAAGYRDYAFSGRLSFCYIATRTSYNENNMSILYIDSIQSATDGGVFKITGSSVRLIKDDPTDTGSVVDIDGNVYPTVKIGDQVWMAADYRAKKYNNGSAIPNVIDNSAWSALTTGAYCTYNNE